MNCPHCGKEINVGSLIGSAAARLGGNNAGLIREPRVGNTPFQDMKKSGFSRVEKFEVAEIAVAAALWHKQPVWSNYRQAVTTVRRDA